MIHNYTTYRVLELFFDYPTRKFQLRKMCRLLKLGMPSVKIHIERLQREGFVQKDEEGIYPAYKATQNERFKLYKKNDVLLRLHESKLISYIEQECTPDAIVLFGSASRGEDTETSDIDLFVVAHEQTLELQQYEKILKRNVNLFFESRIKDVPSELMNNIINGVVVQGYLKVLP